MRQNICLLTFREKWLYLAILFLLSAATCLADDYANQGTIFITGTINDIQNQQTCDQYGCQMGDSWSLEMTFRAPEWNAPGSNYFMSTVLLNCMGGPPCIDGYQATSDFGWGPFGFDILSIDIEDGKLVDTRAACGGYFIEMGEANIWEYVLGFSGTTTGYATPTPEPATIMGLASGTALFCFRRIFASRPMM